MMTRYRLVKNRGELDDDYIIELSEEIEESEEDDDEEGEDEGDILDDDYDDSDEDELQPYDVLEEIVDDFEDNVYELDVEVLEDIEAVLDQLYSQHQVLVRVQDVFEQMTKKELRPIKHFDRELMDDVISAILCELPPDVCSECGAYTERCLCDMDNDSEESEDIED